MLPLVKKSLPDFRPVFEQYGNDLKRAAEYEVQADKVHHP
jgi:hypothetical protein